MFLSEIFPPELIKIGLEAEDKDEVFEEMVDHVCHVKKLNTRKKILEALWERESKMSTGIQKGIAIPHVKTGALENIYGVLGVSKKGIDYDALDGQPVYLVFMLLAPQADAENQLRLLKRLAGLLDNSEFFTDILAQNSSHSVSGVLKKYEDLYITSE